MKNSFKLFFFIIFERVDKYKIIKKIPPTYKTKIIIINHLFKKKNEIIFNNIINIIIIKNLKIIKLFDKKKMVKINSKNIKYFYVLSYLENIKLL